METPHEPSSDEPADNPGFHVPHRTERPHDKDRQGALNTMLDVSPTADEGDDDETDSSGDGAQVGHLTLR